MQNAAGVKSLVWHHFLHRWLSVLAKYGPLSCHPLDKKDLQTFVSALLSLSNEGSWVHPSSEKELVLGDIGGYGLVVEGENACEANKQFS